MIIWGQMTLKHNVWFDSKSYAALSTVNPTVGDFVGILIVYFSLSLQGLNQCNYTNLPTICSKQSGHFQFQEGVPSQNWLGNLVV